jgi:hephaestin
MASTNFEFHAPHWHGNVVEIGHMRTDVTSLTPMEMVTADMVPDNPGVWLIHCHLASHLLMGMQGRFEVLPRMAASR